MYLVPLDRTALELLLPALEKEYNKTMRKLERITDPKKKTNFVCKLVDLGDMKNNIEEFLEVPEDEVKQLSADIAKTSIDMLKGDLIKPRNSTVADGMIDMFFKRCPLRGIYFFYIVYVVGVGVGINFL